MRKKKIISSGIQVLVIYAHGVGEYRVKIWIYFKATMVNTEDGVNEPARANVM